MGMPPEVLEHVLEPFFTTKETDKGNGLGLSMVYGFVTQSGGNISIESRLGFGTRVEFMLPAADPEAGKMTGEARASPDGRPKGHETILVVEDEADVRAIAVEFLRVAGYRVIIASSSRVALELLIVEPDVDLLFTDVVLGSGMNGIELAHEARRIRSGIAVLLTSGYASSAFANGDHEASSTFELLSKPYRRGQLLDAVRAALDCT
jgi:CheY-like chemotaxis protein